MFPTTPRGVPWGANLFLRVGEGDAHSHPPSLVCPGPEDDLFWNEQMSIRVSRMEEEHSKTRKVILVDRRIKPDTTEAWLVTRP